MVFFRHLAILLAGMVVAAGQVAPTFTTQPTSQTAAVGGSVTFTVAASGTAPLAYQWYKDGIAMPGATGSSLIISGVKLSDGGSYRASASNGADRVKTVSAGGNHTLFVKTDGTLWAVGSNNSGQLGDGTTTQRRTLVPVALNVASVSAGSNHTMFVKTNGTLWAMGANTAGQLGDGTTTQRNTPVQVASGAGSVSAGTNHTMFVKTDGTLWAVGNNSFGQLGDGTLTQRNTPVQVASGVASVAAGGSHTLYVKTDGTLWAMGRNISGQLGDGTTTSRSTPVQVATDVASVSAGTSHTMFVKTDGTLWAMGSNTAGQFGDGTTTQRNTPVQVASDAASVSAGGNHTLFVKTDGTLWAVGNNSFGQLGDGTLTQRNTPVQVASGAASVSAGFNHTMFVRTDGMLWAIGSNNAGQLGDGPQTSRGTPVQVASGVASVAAGGNHTMYVKTDGTLWAMGSNQFGQLGDGTLTQRGTPVQVATSVASVSAGGIHTMFVKTDGTLWAMGANSGRLGDGTGIQRNKPVQVASGVASVSAGSHTLYVKTDGTLWAMGANTAGQLGDGTTTQRNTPVQVASGAGSVSAGSNHTMFVKTDGTLWAMGSNTAGQFGDGTTTQRDTPVIITGGILSDVALLSLPAAMITTQPSASSATAGNSVSLEVVASGTALTYQWNKDGVAISGATAATYTINFPLPSDSGSYTVTVANSLGSVTSSAALLTVTFPTAPTITIQPSSTTVTAGWSASFSVVASGTAPLSYQWRKDGTAISGATNSTYSISSTATSDVGSYTVVVTNSVSFATSNPATLTVTAPGTAPRLFNLSVRAALDANQIAIVGFTMSGGAKNVLLRAAGPTLSLFEVPGVMADPKLDLYSGSSRVSTNDNWAGQTTLSAAFASVGAFPYSSTTSLDAALVSSIDGGRTVQVYGPTAGTVLVEAYDAGTGDSQRFTNLSARNKVGVGANILIAGFTLEGSGTRNLLIRAVGPKLTDFNVSGVLADPKLEIYSGTTKLHENDNWFSSLSATFASVGAFALNTGSKDAAITVALPAGGYTVHVSGADGGVGEAIVEIYELP